MALGTALDRKTMVERLQCGITLLLASLLIGCAGEGGIPNPSRLAGSSFTMIADPHASDSGSMILHVSSDDSGAISTITSGFTVAGGARANQIDVTINWRRFVGSVEKRSGYFTGICDEVTETPGVKYEFRFIGPQ